MKDVVKEFEVLNEALGSIFNKVGNIAKSAGSKIANSFAGSKSTNPSLVSKDQAEILGQHRQSVETGQGQRSLYGTVPNNEFTSEIGSAEVHFGKNGQGHVKNINPLLRSLSISKADLQLYDLNKDPLKIRWLFDGVYNFDTIWKEGKNFYYQGVWKDNTKPKPINVIDATNGAGQNTQVVKKPVDKNKYPKNFMLNIEDPTFAISVIVDVLTQQQGAQFSQFNSDIKDGKFVINLRILKRLMQNNYVTGNAGNKNIEYLLPNPTTNNVPKDQEYIMNYFSNFKVNVLDGFVKKDGSHNEHLKTIFINKMRKFLGIAPVEASNQAPAVNPPQKQGSAPIAPKKQHGMRPGMQEGSKLSVSEWIKNTL